MTPLIVAGVSASGLVAGAYVRVFAGGFGPVGRPGEVREAVGVAVRTPPVPRSPYIAEAATALAAALLVWRMAGAGGWVIAAWSYAIVIGVALALIDWRTLRLPDVITLPSYPVLLALLAPSGRLSGALAAAAAFACLYAVMWFARPTGIGLGDVKLAGLIGLLTGAIGVRTTVAAGMGGFLLGALYAVALLVTGRATRKSEFPFGPFMLVGALAAAALPLE
ncbi:prepilin peptidase [Sphaerimonospora sp. CA-214678]|uniref:prepilin peptidase n=1 Tax=Sphaerimonospora sp. CA-214678 TaxID=3240029 RepID=UPI003D8B754C